MPGAPVLHAHRAWGTGDGPDLHEGISSSGHWKLRQLELGRLPQSVEESMSRGRDVVCFPTFPGLVPGLQLTVHGTHMGRPQTTQHDTLSTILEMLSVVLKA